MRLNKEMREAFLDNVMAALRKIDAPDYNALSQAVVAEAEASLPAEVREFAAKWPQYFRRAYAGYPNAYGAPELKPDGTFRRGHALNIKVSAAAPIDTKSPAFRAISEANTAWVEAWQARLLLKVRITATVAAIHTVERLKQTFPELAHHVEIVERQLPAEIDGSNLVAELMKHGMQFSEATS